MISSDLFSIFKSHSNEIFNSIIFCTGIFIIFIIFANINCKFRRKNIIYRSKNIIGGMFKMENEKLTNNNAIYLTKFKHSGLKGYVVHTIYAYYDYFKDPINIFCLLISVGQVWIYFDFRSVIPLFLFGTLHVLGHLYSVGLLLDEETE